MEELLKKLLKENGCSGIDLYAVDPLAIILRDSTKEPEAVVVRFTEVMVELEPCIDIKRKGFEFVINMIRKTGYDSMKARMIAAAYQLIEEENNAEKEI